MKEVVQNEDGHYEFKDRTMEEFFNKEDFAISIDWSQNRAIGLTELHSNQANKILREYFEKCPVVYGPDELAIHNWNAKINYQDNFYARLAFTKPIKKECTKHEPPKNYTSMKRAFCVHCNVELEAVWKVKE